MRSYTKGGFLHFLHFSHCRRCWAGLSVWLLVTTTATAWHGPGHERATRLAVELLPTDVPSFFTKGAAMIAHCSKDPDLFRMPVAPPQVDAAEDPQHYFDIELLDAASARRKDWPHRRSASSPTPSANGPSD